MSVNGIPPALARLAGLSAPVARRATEAKPAAGPGASERAADSAPAREPRAGGAVRPAALKAATLWDLLSDEERAFFSDPAALGSLTYRPGGRASKIAGAPTGQRVDLEA